MAVQFEVLDIRDYNLTENRFGIAKYPTCNGWGCKADATKVVDILKFGHRFHETYCEACASKFEIGQQVIASRPNSYTMGMAKFYGIDVTTFLDLPADDRSVLQKFADAFRKDDEAAMVAIIKESKSLIKTYFHPEDH